MVAGSTGPGAPPVAGHARPSGTLAAHATWANRHGRTAARQPITGGRAAGAPRRTPATAAAPPPLPRRQFSSPPEGGAARRRRRVPSAASPPCPRNPIPRQPASGGPLARRLCLTAPPVGGRRRSWFLPPSGAGCGSRLPRLWPNALPPRHGSEWKPVVIPARDAPGARAAAGVGVRGGTDVHVGSRYRERRSLHTEETFSVAVLLLETRPTSDVWAGQRRPAVFHVLAAAGVGVGACGVGGASAWPRRSPRQGGRRPRPRVGEVGGLDKGRRGGAVLPLPCCSQGSGALPG